MGIPKKEIVKTISFELGTIVWEKYIPERFEAKFVSHRVVFVPFPSRSAHMEEVVVYMGRSPSIANDHYHQATVGNNETLARHFQKERDREKHVQEEKQRLIKEAELKAQREREELDRQYAETPNYGRF